MNQFEVINKFSADHRVAELDPHALDTLNELLSDLDSACVLVGEADPEWPYWLIREVPE